MTDEQGWLAEMMKANVGDPPARVTVSAVRRQRARRQVRVTGLAAVVAVIAVLSAGAGFRLVNGGPAAGGRARPIGIPRYYAEQGAAGNGHATAVIRVTATGKVTAAFRCPGPNNDRRVIFPMTADAHRTFFMVCKVYHRSSLSDSRIYKFHLTASGRVSGYEAVPGGDLGAVLVKRIVVTPDGSQLAVLDAPADTATLTSPAGTTRAQIVVINTRTGAQATWRNASPGTGGSRFDILDVSFGLGGRELVFLGDKTCGQGQNPGRCRPFDQQVRVLAPAASGGLLSDGRIILRRVEHAPTLIYSAVISSDGSTLTVVTESVPPKPQPATARFLQIALRSGRQRVIYQFRGGSGSPPLLIVNADSSGRHFLIEAGTINHSIAGRIQHGQLIKLKPFGTRTVYDAW